MQRAPGAIFRCLSGTADAPLVNGSEGWCVGGCAWVFVGEGVCMEGGGEGTTMAAVRDI